MGLIDGSFVFPPQYLRDDDGKLSTTVNPQYTEWTILLMWINSTLSQAALPYVVGPNTSKSVWIALEQWYASLSRSHIF